MPPIVRLKPDTTDTRCGKIPVVSAFRWTVRVVAECRETVEKRSSGLQSWSLKTELNMKVWSVFLQKYSPRLAAATFVACLLSPGVAVARILSPTRSIAPRRAESSAPRPIAGSPNGCAHGRQHRARRPAQAETDLAIFDDQFPHSYAEFHGHHDVRRLAAGRASPSARSAASQGALRHGRLWYDQPAPRVQATIALFNERRRSKSSDGKPVQTYIPFNDPALKGLASLRT